MAHCNLFYKLFVYRTANADAWRSGAAFVLTNIAIRSVAPSKNSEDQRSLSSRSSNRQYGLMKKQPFLCSQWLTIIRFSKRRIHCIVASTALDRFRYETGTASFVNWITSGRFRLLFILRPVRYKLDLQTIDMITDLDLTGLRYSRNSFFLSDFWAAQSRMTVFVDLAPIRFTRTINNIYIEITRTFFSLS